jgi:hypothetical protein
MRDIPMATTAQSPAGDCAGEKKLANARLGGTPDEKRISGEEYWRGETNTNLRSFDVGNPNLGNRVSDGWDEATKTSYEVKNYSSGNVPRSSDIENQVLKEVWLRDNYEGGGNYNPVWIFIERGPTMSGPKGGLQKMLEDNDIPFIILR